jgi:hypothetical protein
VLALLRNPRTIELLAFKLGPREHLLGAVPLGHHPKGRSLIPWNLHVAGQRLAPGSYLAELVAALGHGATSAGPIVKFTLGTTLRNTAKSTKYQRPAQSPRRQARRAETRDQHASQASDKHRLLPVHTVAYPTHRQNRSHRTGHSARTRNHGHLGRGCSIASSLSPQQRQVSTQDARKGGVDNVLPYAGNR